MEVDGKLGNIQLIDMSNYPLTIHSDNDHLTVKPYELMGSGVNNDYIMKIHYLV